MIGGYSGYANYYENVGTVIEIVVSTGYSPTLVNIGNYYTPYAGIYNSFTINGYVQNMHIGMLSAGETGDAGKNPLLNSSITSSVTIDNLIIDQFYGGYAQSYILSGSSNITINNFKLGMKTLVSGASLSGLWGTTSISGTTAGTATANFIDYQSNYKKLFIIFSGYENDTTTNQTLDFPASFSTVASITFNGTGLTLSASTTALTITAPDSTTTYSGIVIIEGY